MLYVFVRVFLALTVYETQYLSERNLADVEAASRNSCIVDTLIRLIPKWPPF